MENQGRCEATFRSYSACVDAWIKQKASSGSSALRKVHLRFYDKFMYSCTILGDPRYLDLRLLARIMRSPATGESLIFMSNYHLSKDERRANAIMRGAAEKDIKVLFITHLIGKEASDDELRKAFYLESQHDFKLCLTSPWMETGIASALLDRCKTLADTANRVARLFGDPIPFPENEEEARMDMMLEALGQT